MKIAHLADLHCCKEHAEKALLSLRCFTDQIQKSPVDLVVIAGDIWDASMLNTEASGFNRFIDAIRKIACLSPVVCVYGTPSHDTDGSLDVFRKLNSKYGITILEATQAYFIAVNPEDKNRLEIVAEQEAENRLKKAILFGIPEPRKKYLLAENAAGKGETEETIRNTMHSVCYLLASKRKEYASIPAIVLYHGEVSGCSLQNDMTIERGTGISITIDDLSDIGADYYALGHIHKPQQVGKLNAYYAGSIYPKNFGESHKAGFNVVEIGLKEGQVDVTRLEFPHPVNTKYECRWPSVPQFSNLTGKKVWLDISCAREERCLIDASHILRNEIILTGAHEDSRVTISDIPVETVRAAEITEVKTPSKKFAVWADNSNVEITESMAQKVGLLEDDSSKMSAKASGEWELVSVRVRGSIGLKKGVKQDEINLDFDDYAPGLIALSGANGKGKTTLIENCHPYPQLLTRKGKLQDHFFLRDSLREVVYRNTATGNSLKFLIQIDGQNKSGSCKYFAFSKNAEQWEAPAGLDGNLKPYEDFINSTFGPIELFLRTAFITQRPTKNLPDLTDATAGEKKTLFVELAGISYLQQFSDGAAEKAKQEAVKTHDAQIRSQMLETAVFGKESKAQELMAIESGLKNLHTTLGDVTAKGISAKSEMEAKQVEWNTEQTRARQENEAKYAVEGIETEIASLNGEIHRYQNAAQNKSIYETEITEYEVLQKRLEDENAKKQKITEANLKAQTDFQAAKSVFGTKMKTLETERDSFSDQKREIEKQVFTAQNNIKLYERDASEIGDTCPSCGQKLPIEKSTELNKAREQFVAKIKDEKEQIEKHQDTLSKISESLTSLEQQIADLSFDEPEPPDSDIFNDIALNDTVNKLKQFDIVKTRSSLSQAQEAVVRLESLEKQVLDKTKLLEVQKAALQKLLSSVDGHEIKANLDAAIKLHAELTEQYTEVKAQIAGTEATVESMKKVLIDIAVQETELKSLSEIITKSKQEAAEWELVSKAFGKDGIQALELDALAPGITQTANRILQSAYGDRFRIDIQTTRMGGSGKKTKQIEDFLIYVIDSEDGEAVLLDDKSGGEAVWIKRAIYDAFAVIRKRNTNFAFLTCFQDETDGALDSDAKTAYCRMLEAAHEESTLRHTVIITHSNEVKAMIEQKIEMENFIKG